MIRQLKRYISLSLLIAFIVFAWIVTVVCPQIPSTAHADPVTFYQSFAGNINFQMTGASLRQNPNSGNACLVAPSRSAALTDIPVGATIRAAYLYWAGSGATADNQVVFQGVTTNATRTFSETFNYFGTAYPFFSGFADVTAQVAGNGTYTLSGLTVNTGSPHCPVEAVVAGWSLIVLYEDAAEPLRVINIYDGFRFLRASQIVLTPSNFQIPPAGCGTPGDCKWGVITWEGDVENSTSLGGFTENLFINGTAMTSPLNPINNQFNSTIDLMGGQPDPPGLFTYGADVDIYSPLPLAAGDTSAATTYQSGGDLVLLSAEVFSVRNTPVADLSINKSHFADFIVGQQGAYTIRVNNNGPDDATGAITVTDTLPAGLTYVSGTGTGWSCSATGQDVTCTHPGPLTNGASLPDINLTVDVAASAAPSVTNTASVTGTLFDNQPGNSSSSDPTTVINLGPASGTKLLYFYMATAPAPDTDTIQRVVNPGDTDSGDIPAVSPGNAYSALLSPITQAPLTLQAGDAAVSLWLRRRDGGGTRDVTVTLDYFGGSTGALGSATLNNILGNNAWQYITFTINLAAPVTLNPNTTLRFTLTHEPSSSRSIRARSLRRGVRSRIALDASTVINVDSVDAYTDVVYPGGVVQSSYPPNTNIRVRSVVSDPFGHDDITSASITILDPTSNPVVTGASMTEVAPLSPGWPGASKTFEYPFTIPAGPNGTWTARVTANEGTEGTIADLGQGTFTVGIPAITISKTVTTISNPVEGATNAKAIPGAIMEYVVLVTNAGLGPADADSVVITDPLDANLRLVLNSPIAPVTFSDSASGLSFNSSDVGSNDTPLPYNDVALSNDGGTTFLPLASVSEAGGIDATVPKIDFIRINPKGTFQGVSGGSLPAFTLRFRVQVE
jgi:uncharacterized repeat protein (TIGR01451 family)